MNPALGEVDPEKSWSLLSARRGGRIRLLLAQARHQNPNRPAV